MELTIASIVSSYVKLGDLASLEKLKQHRQDLLTRFENSNVDFGQLKETCRLELDDIEAGIEKLLGDVRGFVDVVDEKTICGWFQYRNHPERPVPIKIYFGGQLIGEMLSDGFRADLLNVGIGSGRHGFSFNPPQGSYRPPLLIRIQVGRSRFIEYDVKGTSAELSELRASTEGSRA